VLLAGIRMILDGPDLSDPNPYIHIAVYLSGFTKKTFFHWLTF
jgi:hypothetical protein